MDVCKSVIGRREKMKICIGLVIKGGKDFIVDWITSTVNICDMIIVIDNGADTEVRNLLINHPLVKHYIIQKDMERNMSRDYQKILYIAREENCQWVINLDSDELIQSLSPKMLYSFLINCEDDSVGFPLFEMRGDKDHYVMVKDYVRDEMKDGRLCHKAYKTLSHFKFDEKDKHGCSIPPNCQRSKKFINVPIKHLGHMTKQLREEKRQKYIEFQNISEQAKDYAELKEPWFEEDDSKITIKEWEPIYKMIKESNNEISSLH